MCGNVFKMPDLAPSPKKCEELNGIAAADSGSIETFEDYYPVFLCGHSRPGTKLLHFIATLMYIVDVGTFLADGFRPLVGVKRYTSGTFSHDIFPVLSQHLFTALFKGFGLSFASHYLIEGNQPATLSHPFMSVMADHRMCLDLVGMKLRMW